jgi:hypothetical protein
MKQSAVRLLKVNSIAILPAKLIADAMSALIAVVNYGVAFC